MSFRRREKDQVRNQLAGNLCAVLAQKLLPARQGGRVTLYELPGQHASGGEFDP